VHSALAKVNSIIVTFFGRSSAQKFHHKLLNSNSNGTCNGPNPPKNKPDQAGQTEAVLKGLSPEPVAHLPQNRLVPMLLARALRTDGGGGGPCLGAVLWGREVTGVRAAAGGGGDGGSSGSGSSSGGGSGCSGGSGSGGGALEVVARTAGGSAELYRCDYVIGADGANSTVRWVGGWVVGWVGAGVLLGC
jgi:hypothetical protein